jgi:hypothetical protein
MAAIQNKRTLKVYDVSADVIKQMRSNGTITAFNVLSDKVPVPAEVQALEQTETQAKTQPVKSQRKKTQARKRNAPGNKSEQNSITD